MKNCLFIFLLLICSNLLAQSNSQKRIDSLEAAIPKATNDSIRANLFKDLAWEFQKVAKYDTAMVYALKTLKLSEQNNFSREEAFAHDALGNIYTQKSKHLEALTHFDRAMAIRADLKDTLGMGVVHNNKGLAYRVMGNYPRSLQSYANALKIFEKLNEKHRVAVVYDNMGTIYKREGNPQKSLQYALAAVKINEELKEFSSLIVNYINVAGFYLDNEDFDKSLDFYFKALKLTEQTGYNRQVPLIYNQIGSTFEKKGDFKQSLTYQLKSLAIAKQQGIKKDEADAYRLLGVLYYNNDRPKEALPYYLNSLAYSLEVQDHEGVKDSYEYLANCYYVLEDYKNAIENYDLFVNLKDSLYSEASTRKLTQAVMNFEFEKTQDSVRLINEKEIALRDASIANVQKQQLLLVAGLMALSIIGGLLYYQNNQRKKHNRKLNLLNNELDKANKSKIQFLNILNHDLRRPVANLIHYLHLKKNNGDLLDEDSRYRLEQQAVVGAETLMNNMEDLLLWSKGQMTNFSPQISDVRVQDLFYDIQRNFLHEAEKIDFIFEDNDGIVLQTDKHYLETIVRNLTSNAVKALQDTENAIISWKATSLEQGVLLSISDNGPGADSQTFKALYDDQEIVGVKSGLGLHLIRDLARAIDCSLRVETTLQRGTTIHLHVSKRYKANK